VIIKTDFENFWQGFGIFCTGASAGVYTRNSISANSNAGVASRGTCSALFQASIYLSIYLSIDICICIKREWRRGTCLALSQDNKLFKLNKV
jgi:hypothetical protein